MIFSSKKKREIIWEAWLVNAIDEWSRENGGKKFSDAVNYLLSCEMNRREYFREDSDPGMKEILKPEPEYPEGVIPFDHRLSGKLVYLGKCKILSFKYHGGFLTRTF